MPGSDLRSIHNQGAFYCHTMEMKSKITPIKVFSIRRVELMGVVCI